MNFEKNIPVKRSIQTTYTHLPDRFCTHCGAKGIYEDDCNDYYVGCGWFCFHCNDQRPHQFYDADTLDLCVNGQATVVDFKQWTEMQSECDILMTDMMRNVCDSFARSLYGDGTKP